MGFLFFLGIFVGILLEWTWKKWAPLGFSLFQRLTCAPSPPCDSAAPVASSPQAQKEHLDIRDGDLHHLQKLDEKNDGGPLWKHLMDHKTPNMICQAWQRDSAVLLNSLVFSFNCLVFSLFFCCGLINSDVFMQTGPPQYYTRTVYEDATPEMVRDFFWDDEFRLQWDDMLLNATTIDECSATGAMAVHWVRKVSRVSLPITIIPKLFLGRSELFCCVWCSFRSSAVTENTSLVVVSGNQQAHTTA